MFSYHHFLPTLGWGEQSTWLAANGSLAHLWAWPTPTPGGEPDDHRKAPVAAVWVMCAAFGRGVGKTTQDTPIEAARPHENSEEERLRGAPFRALWGRSIFVLG